MLNSFVSSISVLCLRVVCSPLLSEMDRVSLESFPGSSLYEPVLPVNEPVFSSFVLFFQSTRATVEIIIPLTYYVNRLNNAFFFPFIRKVPERFFETFFTFFTLFEKNFRIIFGICHAWHCVETALPKTTDISLRPSQQLNRPAETANHPLCWKRQLYCSAGHTS